MAERIEYNCYRGGASHFFKISGITNNSKVATVKVHLNNIEKGDTANTFRIEVIDETQMWGDSSITLNDKEMLALKEILNSKQFECLEAGLRSVK